MSAHSPDREHSWHNELHFTTNSKKPPSPNSINELQKYRIIKMMASGDYVCNDQQGNYYLLVCHQSRGGLFQFKAAVKNNFRRNNTNRALLTPLEDIEHGGLKFTAYMLPANSIWVGQVVSTKAKSEIYCLSLLYTLINKVLKPLLQIFNVNAQGWLHLQNIWIKQSKIFYILNERKKQPNSLKRTEQKFMDSPREAEGQAYQKKLLRKLCQILVPYFKIDPELKSFLSVVVDAMLNEEFTISEVCLLLNDKTKRRVFMEQKIQSQAEENNELYFVPYHRNDMWNKRKLFVPGPRRSLINQTLNIQKLSQWEESTEFYKKELKNVGETIDIPPSLQSKRNSFSHSRMFDFKDKSKKRKSLSTQKNGWSNRKQNMSSITEDIQKKLRTYVKKEDSNNKYGTISLSIQEKAYRKYNEKVDSQKKDSSRYESFNINEQDKKLRSCLLLESQEKNKRASTIQIGNLKNFRSRVSENRFETITHEDQSKNIWNKKFETKNNLQQLHQLQQIQKERQLQRQRLNQLEKQRQRILEKKQKQLERNRQKEKEIEKELEKIRAKERQLEIERERVRQREKQIQRQKQQKQKQKQRERQRQRQKSRQREKEKQKQKQKQKQKERERQIEKQKERQKQKEREKEKAKEEQKLRKQKQEQSQLRKIESQKTVKTGSLNQVAGVNLDEIQIVSPQMKSVLDAKKKQAEQKQREKEKQRLEKNKPPLPSTKKIQLKNPPIEQQIEEIVLNTNNQKPGTQKDEKNSRPIQQPISNPKQQPQQQKQEPKKDKDEVESQQRTKTVGSEIASSCGPKKPVSKQVAEYMHMINKMGEGVAKSSRISNKLEDVEWFTGIYFIYKRFLFERKQIQKWLETKTPNLTRYQQKIKGEWQQWFNSDDKKSLQEKVKLENENILSSIIKMNKKIMKKQLPGNFLFHAALSRHSDQQSKIAVSEVVKEYDSLEEKQKLNDDQILTHINQLFNALYIIAELDGKIRQRKPLIQILKKKSGDQLSQFSDFIYDLYIKD